MTDNDSSNAGSQASGATRRVQRPVAPMVGAVILADCSGSMDYRDSTGSSEIMPLRRIDRLARVLNYLLVRVRVQTLICFNDVPVEVSLSGRIALPEPAGGTNLTLALEHVGGLTPKPLRCIVLSDGYPNDDTSALEEARRLKPMVMDCYYIGPDEDTHALTFMRELAAAGGAGGRSGHFDMVDPLLLGGELERRLLTGRSGQ